MTSFERRLLAAEQALTAAATDPPATGYASPDVLERIAQAERDLDEWDRTGVPPADMPADVREHLERLSQQFDEYVARAGTVPSAP